MVEVPNPLLKRWSGLGRIVTFSRLTNGDRWRGQENENFSQNALHHGFYGIHEASNRFHPDRFSDPRASRVATIIGPRHKMTRSAIIEGHRLFGSPQMPAHELDTRHSLQRVSPCFDLNPILNKTSCWSRTPECRSALNHVVLRFHLAQIDPHAS